MERFLMVSPAVSVSEDNDLEGTFSAKEYLNQEQKKEEDDDLEGTFSAEEYSKSKEAQEATWWDAAKELGIQSGLGFAKAYTWPLDVLKMALIGEGLSDIDDIEMEFEKAGKPFDRNKYIKNVMEQAELIPTQDLLERTIDEKYGTNLNEPKTRTGKFFNKLFFLRGLLRQGGAGQMRSAAGGVAGGATTAALREAGAPEILAELAGDVTGTALTSVRQQARNLTRRQREIQNMADAHGLPLMELMFHDELPSSAKISSTRQAALDRQLSMSSEEAIINVANQRIPISQLRNQGVNLQTLEDTAYNQATALARANPTIVSTEDLVADIEREIARIRSTSPSTSTGEKAAIRVLQDEIEALTNPPSRSNAPQILGPNGQPINPPSNARTPKQVNVEQMLEQTRKYNDNVRGIYRKAEFTGAEDEVRQAYAFLNERIRDTVERQAGSQVVEAHRNANQIFAQNIALERIDNMINHVFRNGEFSPKRLRSFLDSRNGAIVRRDIGEQGVRELRDIAEYGERAQRATRQLANSSGHSFDISQWGPLAGFLLNQVPKAGVALGTIKPMYNYIRGWTLTRPAARTVYRGILRNAANGSFKNMAKDFSKLEDEVIKEFGSIEEFVKQGIRELPFYEDDED